ncbi:alpha/beta fold hydrolase [Spirosoma aerolatum]|uniref:alpha/beta fold hydrolase n=1 Tax=Spirosoma aerolatum TaxID=1211326 RepID=UPI0029371A0E|nr:alpha/beta hydrolase [Spirosoma aerolatum]
MYTVNRALSALTAISMSLLTLSGADAQLTKTGVTHVVLVHGAFADGSSWSKVIPLLEAKGHTVIAVQNPLTSLTDDVAAAKRAIALQNAPVLLVGHSWGGAVITEAGNDPKVAGLVYVAAGAPDEGQSFGEMGQAAPPAPGTAEIRPDAAGFLSLTAKGIKDDFAQDLSEAETRLLFATQGPWSVNALGDKISKAAWKPSPPGTLRPVKTA